MFNCCDCRKEGATAASSPYKPSNRCGCGIIFAADHKGALIVDGLVPGGSAEASGLLQHGDVLIEVDNIDVYCRPVGRVGPLLLGVPGSSVQVTVLRGEEKIKMTLQRRPTQLATSIEMSNGRAPQMTRWQTPPR